MCEITVKLDCPHCFDSKVVKNGRKGNGSQNYLCKKCGKQFQHEYVYWGCKMDYKRLIISMLLNGNGIRDIVKTLSVSMGCVLRTLVKCGENIVIKPSKQHYHKVQIDELYSFVKNKGKKVWILYAYDAETDEILSVSAGKRSKKQLKDLLKRLGNITVDWWCTDGWKIFGETLPYEQHLIGKRFTKAIEGINTSLRNTCKRLHRRTTSFSKKVRNHWYAIKMTIEHRNKMLSYI